MRIDVTGRTALVTGSTQGIGAAIAIVLTRVGARKSLKQASAPRTGARLIDGGYVDSTLPDRWRATR